MAYPTKFWNRSPHSCCICTSYLNVTNDSPEQLATTVVGPAPELSPAREVLVSLLSIGTLRLRAKAIDVAVDHARSFQSTRILIDVRPVFAPDNPLDLAGYLIAHTLKIEYYENDETREIFIAMDELDLEELQSAISRAKSKAAVIRKALAAALHDLSTQSAIG